MKNIEARIQKLEKQYVSYEDALAGTSISRTLLDLTLFKEYGLDLNKAITGREASIVWCLGLGSMQEAKELFYGHTMEEAVDKAEGRREG